MLTLDALNNLPESEVFASGEIENSPEGVYMTDSDVGRKLLWVAKRGYVNDWAIYIHWASNGYDFVLENGDKVTSKDNIQKLVPCDEAAFKRYRF